LVESVRYPSKKNIKFYPSEGVDDYGERYNTTVEKCINDNEEIKNLVELKKFDPQNLQWELTDKTSISIKDYYDCVEPDLCLFSDYSKEIVNKLENFEFINNNKPIVDFTKFAALQKEVAKYLGIEHKDRNPNIEQGGGTISSYVLNVIMSKTDLVGNRYLKHKYKIENGGDLIKHIKGNYKFFAKVTGTNEFKLIKNAFKINEILDGFFDKYNGKKQTQIREFAKIGLNDDTELTDDSGNEFTNGSRPLFAYMCFLINLFGGDKVDDPIYVPGGAPNTILPNLSLLKGKFSSDINILNALNIKGFVEKNIKFTNSTGDITVTT